MKVQYIAYDGKIFDNKNECEAYERRAILMGSFNGIRTYNFEDDAYFVYIPNAEILKTFHEAFDYESKDAKDIFEIGFYIFDSDELCYRFIDLETFEGMRKFIRENIN